MKRINYFIITLLIVSIGLSLLLLLVWAFLFKVRPDSLFLIVGFTVIAMASWWISGDLRKP